MLVDESLIGHTSRQAGVAAAAAERSGFDRVWATESVTDGFIQAWSACQATSSISLGTAIIVAFARNPMTTAYAAWDLAASSSGRFTLGMGTQVRAHIERRFSMPWSEPVERMRDYIEALRAIFSSWRTGERLDHRGRFYQHTLMNPVFTPPPHDHEIPLAIAAGPAMTALAGELCECDPSRHDDDRVPRPRHPAGTRPWCCGIRTAARHDEIATSVHGDGRHRRRGRPSAATGARTDRLLREHAGISPGARHDRLRRVLQSELHALSREGKWAEMAERIDEPLEFAIAFRRPPRRHARLVTERRTRIDRGRHSDGPSRAGPSQRDPRRAPQPRPRQSERVSIAVPQARGRTARRRRALVNSMVHQ